MVRCHLCNKKIKLSLQYECYCKKMFCIRHKPTELHKCTFKYFEKNSKKIENENPKIVNSKVELI